MSIRRPDRTIEVHVDPIQVVVAPYAEVLAILKTIKQQGANIMGQTEDLRAAVAQVGTDIGEVAQRILDRLAELGEPDADLSAEIATLQGFGTTLDGLAQPAPVEPPVEPPVEG